LSSPFAPPEMRASWRWAGPALAALGLIAIATATGMADRSPLARWVVSETLAPVKVLPLIALAAGFAVLEGRSRAAAMVLFVLGIGGGLFAEDVLLRLLDKIPGALSHLFLTAPISYLAVGAALVVSARWRMFVVPPAAAVLGVMAGLSIRLADPSLHEPVYTWMPVLITLWIVVAVTLCLSAFWHSSFLVFGRIFGSWMLAIGLLSGGASLIPKRAPSLPAVARPPAPEPGNESAIPALPLPGQPPLFPGGQPFRQP
jgi:hypothetical protein